MCVCGVCGMRHVVLDVCVSCVGVVWNGVGVRVEGVMVLQVCCCVGDCRLWVVVYGS